MGAANIGVRHGRIARIGAMPRAETKLVIDASGKFMAPGAHRHPNTRGDIGILLDRTAESAVRQGATAHVIGNCGDSAAPISEKYRDLAARRFEYYGKLAESTGSMHAQYLELLGEKGIWESMSWGSLDMGRFGPRLCRGPIVKGFLRVDRRNEPGKMGSTGFEPVTFTVSR